VQSEPGNFIPGHARSKSVKYIVRVITVNIDRSITVGEVGHVWFGAKRVEWTWVLPSLGEEPVLLGVGCRVRGHL